MLKSRKELERDATAHFAGVAVMFIVVGIISSAMYAYSDQGGAFYLILAISPFAVAIVAAKFAATHYISWRVCNEH